MKILLILTCAQRLHDLEFVKPVEKILEKSNTEFFTKHYSEISKEDLQKADKVIICGTSLKDNEFVENVKRFEWLKEIEKPILGICAGMQIISLVFGGKSKKKKEIGFYFENFTKDFLGLKGKQEIYHLHNNYVGLPSGFEEFTNSKIPQAIKHKKKEIYGVLFHPEVRNKKLVEDFVKI